MDNGDTRINVMGSCTEHIILYAKHWYGKSEKGIMHDLAHILGEVTGVYTEYMSVDDVRRCIASAWAEVSPSLPEAVRNDATLEMLGWKWAGWNETLIRNPEEVIIGQLSILDPRKVKFVEGDKVDESRMAKVRFGDKANRNPERDEKIGKVADELLDEIEAEGTTNEA